MGFLPADPQAQAISISLLLVAVSVLPLLPARLPKWLQVLVRLSAFVVLTILVRRHLGSPFSPHFDTDHANIALWQRLIEAGWWLVAARAGIAAGRLLVVLENRPRETRIVSDLMAGAIYVFTILAIINFSFDVPIRGLLATSGIIAIGLGLALQSTLSDVFSGIAVGLERPYKPGDLIWVEGNIEGRVVQLNWRSTQIATGQDNIAIVPNSIMAKARLINRSAPTPVRGDTISLELDPAANPERCFDALEAAIRACRIPLEAPKPSVACNGLKGDGALYEIGFYVASSEYLTAARSEIFKHAQRHLRHAGIALAVAGLAALPRMPIPTPKQLLEESDLFGVLETAEREQLAEHFTNLWLQPGDVLIREGEMAEALYVVASGTGEITRHELDGTVVLHRVSPGESLGAIGLITGTTTPVTVTALTLLKVYRLDKADIAAAIKANPDLAAGLEALAKRGQAALRRFATENEKAQLDKPDVFLLRLRNFLHTLRL